MKHQPQWDRVLIGPALATLGLASVAFWQFQRLFTEEPRYDVERRVGPLEIRKYAPTVRAETTVESEDWREAFEVGFHRLTGYVFGDNDTGELSAATSTGAQTPERIAMTAPVSQTTNALGPWRMAFTMPGDRTLDSLPTPTDHRVNLTCMPSRRVAVLRFSGLCTSDRIAAKSSELRALARSAGLSTKGEVEFAGYDAPITLPFIRRNEVWVELGGSFS
jgi:hypothetical protein